MKKYLYGLLMMSVLFSCSRNPVTGKREFMLMSEGQEINMGKQNDPAVVASFGLYEDDTIQEFINVKGKEMAAISHRSHLDYQFRVLDSPVVNAFAVPGGYVYFTRGILAHFNNEAEFAGVLGHEIGHITARHSAKQYSQGMLAQLGFIAGVIFSEDFRNVANEANQALGLLFLSFSRGHESESDRLGVEYSTEVGYDSHEMADFFNTLKRLSGDSGGVPTFLSTHPDPADRFNKVHEMSDEIQAEKGLSNLKVNRDEYLALIDGLTYGVDPKQGYTDDNVFYHPDLKFEFPYPNSWKLANAPTQVQIAPSDGKSLIIFSLAQGNNLQQAVQTDVQKNELTVIESSNTRVNGLSAIALISEQAQTDQQGNAGTPIRLLSYFIQYGDYIYKFHGMALKTDFNKYYNDLQSTMKGFKQLNDPSRINVVPARIKIHTVTSNQTLQKALLAGGIPQDKLQELSIVNGMELNANLKVGTKIKLVKGKIWE